MVNGAVDELDPSGFSIDASTVVGAIVILVVAYLLVRVISLTLTYASEHAGRYRITVKMLIPISRMVIYATVLYLILVPIFELTATQALAFSGLLGAALGFGLKDLFANIVSGLFMIVEQPYQIGDKVKIDGQYGEITDIGLRSTKINTADDDDVSIPNYLSFTETVSNANSGSAHMLVPVEVHVSNDADLDTATRIVRDAVVSSRYFYTDDDHPYDVLVEDEAAYRRIRVRAYIDDLRNERIFRADVTRRALKGFDDAGVPTPDLAVVDD